MNFREATLADVVEIARLRSEEWGEQSYWETRVAGYLAGTHHPQQALAPRVAFVAEEGDAMVAFIAGHLTRRFNCDGELEWINTTAKYRRTGMASMLVRMLAQWFVEHHAKRVCVNSSIDNGTARSFYAKHGAQSLNEHWMVWDDIASVLDAKNSRGHSPK